MVDELQSRRLRTPTAEEMDAFMAQQFGTSSATDDRGIEAKLALVQQHLRAPKNQKNSFGGYNYRSCEDILEAVKPLLFDVGLTLTISDEIVHLGDRFYVKATTTVTDGKGAVTTTAYAREAGDRKGMDDSQITGSASSYARKYALNGLFCIDDTKDADSNEQRAQRDNAPAPRQQQPPRQQAPAPQPDQNTQQRPHTDASEHETPPPPKGGRPASEKQVNAVFAIAKRAGANAEEWAAEANADSAETLSGAQASWLIEKYGGPR